MRMPRTQVRDLAPTAAQLGVTATGALASGGGSDIALTWTPLRDAADAEARVAAAAELRVTADNGLNAQSSRSHLVVVYSLLGSRGERRGQIALVDLAGSERLARTEAVGERREEAVAINRSLSALGDVLHALIGKTVPSDTPSARPRSPCANSSGSLCGCPL